MSKRGKAQPFRRRVTNVHNTRVMFQSKLAQQPDEIRSIVEIFDRSWLEAEAAGLPTKDAEHRAIDAVEQANVSPEVKEILAHFRELDGPLERDSGDVPLRERAGISLLVLLNSLHEQGIEINGRAASPVSPS